MKNNQRNKYLAELNCSLKQIIEFSRIPRISFLFLRISPPLPPRRILKSDYGEHEINEKFNFFPVNSLRSQILSNNFLLYQYNVIILLLLRSTFFFYRRNKKYETELN